MAKVDIVHEEPKPPQIIDVVLHLSPREAHDLLALVSVKDPYAVTRDVGVKTANIRHSCDCIREALKDIETPKDL